MLTGAGNCTVEHNDTRRPKLAKLSRGVGKEMLIRVVKTSNGRSLAMQKNGPFCSDVPIWNISQISIISTKSDGLYPYEIIAL
jgi:hypothetical protein